MKNQLYKSILLALFTSFLSCAQEKNTTNTPTKQANLAESKAGERREFEILPGQKVAFRWIPATGEKGFLMGSPEGESEGKNETQHKVILSKGFWMAETETTQGLWEEVMGNNPSHFKNAGKNAPVEQVSYKDIEGFIKKVNDSGKLPVGMGVRLPTETEWEYACRAGTSTPFHTGGNLTTDQANYDGDYPYNGAAKGKNRRSTIAVGNLSANAWGLHDMHGNVWEWCSDWYGAYKGGTERDPAGASIGNFRVLRGGSWCYLAEDCRSANRVRFSPSRRSSSSGFRLVIQVQ